MIKVYSGTVLALLAIASSLSMAGEAFVVEHTAGMSYNPQDEYVYQKRVVTRSIDGNESNITISERQQIIPQPIPYIFRPDDSNVTTDINNTSFTMPTKVTEDEMKSLGDEFGHRDTALDDNMTVEGNATIKSTRATPTKTNITHRTLPASGRLYFKHKGSPRACSASLVDSPDILVTAGHCLAMYGVIHTDMQYFPSPETSKVHYKAKAFFIPDGWRKNSDFSQDFGIIKLSQPVGGRTISLSSLYNPPKVATVTAYGYPGGATLYQVPGVYKYSSGYLYMLNSLRSGSSGGPWIDSHGRVAGVNSFHYVDNPNVMYSPYFSSEFKRLMRQAKAYK